MSAKKLTKEELEALNRDTSTLRARTRIRIMREEIGQAAINKSPESKAFYEFLVERLRSMLPPDEFSIYYNSRDVDSGFRIDYEQVGIQDVYRRGIQSEGLPDFEMSYPTSRPTSRWWANFLNWLIRCKGDDTPQAQRYVGDWKFQMLTPVELQNYTDFILFFEIDHITNPIDHSPAAHMVLLVIRNLEKDYPPEMPKPSTPSKWLITAYESSDLVTRDNILKWLGDMDHSPAIKGTVTEQICANNIANNFNVFFDDGSFGAVVFEEGLYWNREGACGYYAMFAAFFFATCPTTPLPFRLPKPDLDVWRYFVHRIMETYGNVGGNSYITQALYPGGFRGKGRMQKK